MVGRKQYWGIIVTDRKNKGLLSINFGKFQVIYLKLGKIITIK